MRAAAGALEAFLMFDSVSQLVNVSKPDLLSVVANVPPGSLNGCKWCRKTILWNGGTWVHAKDQPKCDWIRCQGVWVEGQTKAVQVDGLFRTLTKLAPVGRCERCGREDAAWLIGGRWHMPLWSECPAAVATPVAQTPANQEGVP